MKIKAATKIAVWAAAAILATGLALPPCAAGGAAAVTPDGLPPLGQWLLRADGQPANWLGQPYQGKELREPINIVIIDNVSATAEEAIARLTNACGRAGYPSRVGHSGGYLAHIGGSLYGQLPAQANHAFSNAFFGFDNNHGRIFGPARYGDGFIFTAAFSREVIDLFAAVKHRYASFTAARDDFGARLGRSGGYSLAGTVAMQNALPADSARTTGDHDGQALLLTARP